MKSLLNIISLLALSLAFSGITLLHADSGPGVTAKWKSTVVQERHPFWYEGITYGEFLSKVAEANRVKVVMPHELRDKILDTPPGKYKGWTDTRTLKALTGGRDLQFSVQPDGSWLFTGSGNDLPPKPVPARYGSAVVEQQLADSDFQHEVERELLGTWYVEGYGRTRYFVEFKGGGDLVFTGMEHASAPPEPTNEERFYGRVVESSSGSWSWAGGRILNISRAHSTIDGYWIPQLSSGTITLKDKSGYGSGVVLKRSSGGRLSYSAP